MIYRQGKERNGKKDNIKHARDRDENSGWGKCKFKKMLIAFIVFQILYLR